MALPSDRSPRNWPGQAPKTPRLALDPIKLRLEAVRLPRVHLPVSLGPRLRIHLANHLLRCVLEKRLRSIPRDAVFAGYRARARSGAEVFASGY